MTEAEMKAVLATLPREEKEMLLRLPPHEAMLIMELHHVFPGVNLQIKPGTHETPLPADY